MRVLYSMLAHWLRKSGRLVADVWFMGMEEAGGGEGNIRTRLKFRPVMDNAEAHRMQGVTDLHWGRRKIQRTWRGMCYIMLRLEGEEPTKENLRRYQAEKLGRTDGNTMLTELMPIPKPKVKRWGDEELIHQFKSREEYYEIVKPRRIAYLRDLITEHRPKVVVCYGKAFWPDFREVFSGHTFTLDGPFKKGSDSKTPVILTGHFAARSMNGRFDELATIIQSII